MTTADNWIRESRDGVSFAVRVTPRASRTAITGVMGEGADRVLKIALAAPPVDGKANAELIAHLAGIFNVTRPQVEVVSGKSSKNKVVRIRSKTAAEIAVSLTRFFPDNRSGLP